MSNNKVIAFRSVDTADPLCKNEMNGVLCPYRLNWARITS